MAPSTKTLPTRSLETGMLAFARSVQIAEGVFHGVRGQGEERQAIPIEVLAKGVRGQSSEDNAKNPGKSNPQSVEFAAVPPGYDHLELSFSVRVLPGAMRPHACDNKDVASNYEKLAKTYANRQGFRQLAELYVWNIANGRFAWRNRWQTDAATVRITFDERALVFNPFDPHLSDLATPVALDGLAKAMTSGSADDLKVFVDRFSTALQTGSFTFAVVWAAAMEPGQEVFPSQEYIRDSEKDKDVSRIYAKLPMLQGGRMIQQASMHSQKIGAALRHIDVWHGDAVHGAIAINPYGGVQETSAVLRDKGSKRSFYDIRRKPEALFAALEDATQPIPPDMHFLMANLIRGGVFGSATVKGG